MRTAPAVDIDAATAEWLSRVQSHCPEQVVAACPFAPPRNEIAGRAAGLGGGLAFGFLGRMVTQKAEKAVNRDRAGGLPGSFILAVTPANVYVYEARHSRSGTEVVGQSAVWDRESLQVADVKRGGLKTDVRLRLPGGQEVTCTAGTHEYTDRFIDTLRAPVAPPV
jgi:hypothetical protein